MLSPRRVAATAIFGILAIVLIILVIAGSLTPGAALTTAAFAAALAALAFIALGVRRLDGKAHRLDLRVKQRETGATETVTVLREIESRLDRLADAVERAAGQRDDDLAAILSSLGEDRVNAMTRAREVDELREEVHTLARDRA
jgi:membrane protein implicated in regulation of membrane protease activity